MATVVASPVSGSPVVDKFPNLQRDSVVEPPTPPLGHAQSNSFSAADADVWADQRSSQVYADSEPVSTDSMVTVRLSEPVSTLPDSTADENANASRESTNTLESVAEDVVEARKSSLEMLSGSHPEDNLINGLVEDEDNGSEHLQEKGIELEDIEEQQLQDDAEDDAATHPLEPEVEDGKFELPATVRFSIVDDAAEVVEANEQHDMSEASTMPEEDESTSEFRHTRSSSSSSVRSDASGTVDWLELEQAETREEGSDESMALLLARLEQENNALATDPRSAPLQRVRKQSRPPSIAVLKKLVQDPPTQATRLSLLPHPPPMTELEFWAALVKDYPQTAQRLPTLTSNKIKSGVPPPLRGVVWMSMVGARDKDLSDQFEKLALGTSPYEVLIGKDIGRSFPGVEMFRDADGEGQQMLARVLKAFSLYDDEIGYCQGLGFLVGPLLMQMGDKDAFCVLVKLMENYDLRSCFQPNLAGLHLRIFQFQRLLTQHMPTLAAHLTSMQVEAAYLSQWFLSFFAVTCPLPMLFRIYDVIFAEGATATVMRVALSLMKRNEAKIMESTEFEEIMQLLLSRALWEPYSADADDLVDDFMSFSGVVTTESLQALEHSFKEASNGDTAAWYGFLPDATTAASRFLGRLWTSQAPAKSNTLTPAAPSLLARPTSFLRRTPSKQSLNSAEISSEGTNSVTTATTEPTEPSRDSSGDVLSVSSKPESMHTSLPGMVSKEDRDLHGQIEDLLMALSEMQRQQALLTNQLQKEREERSDDWQAVQELISKLKTERHDTTAQDRRRTLLNPLEIPPPELKDILERVDQRLVMHREFRNSTILETKQRLRDSLNRSKNQLVVETTRSAELVRQIDSQQKETEAVREMLRQAEVRIEEQSKEKARLDKIIQDMYASPISRKNSLAWSEASGASTPASQTPPMLPRLWRTDTNDSHMSITSITSPVIASSPMFSRPGTPKSATPPGSTGGTRNSGGLRELKLGRSDSISQSATPGHTHSLSTSSASFPKRNSSLATQSVLATPAHVPANEDDLLLELVNAKTSEAMARQELEEVKAKLDAMRKMLGVSPLAVPQPAMTTGSSLHRPTPSDVTVVAATSPYNGAPAEKLSPTPPASTTSSSSGGAGGLTGAFWSWGKRNVSPG